MVVATDVLPRHRVGEERAQREAIDQLVAGRERHRVLVTQVDVIEVQRLRRSGHLELHAVDRRAHHEVMLVTRGSRHQLAQVRPLDPAGQRRPPQARKRPAARRRMPLGLLARARARVCPRLGLHARPPPERRVRDTPSEVLGGLHVAGRQHAAAGTRLCHRPEVAAEPIRVVVRAFGSRVRRREPEADPDHPVLRREDGELRERSELVAAGRRRVREAGGELVAPALQRPHRARRVHERLELRRGAAHVRRASEHDRIGRREQRMRAHGVLDRQEVSHDAAVALRRLRATRDGLGKGARPTARGVIDDRDRRHVNRSWIHGTIAFMASSTCGASRSPGSGSK